MSLTDDIKLLSDVTALAPLGREALRLLAFSAEPIQLTAGQTLFSEDEAATGGFVVRSGRIRLFRAVDGPDEGQIVGHGALIGELALICEVRRPASAEAVDDAELLRLPRAVFCRMMEEFPGIAGRLRKRLERRTMEIGTALEMVDATYFTDAVTAEDFRRE